MTRQQVTGLLVFYPRIGDEVKMCTEMLRDMEDDWGVGGATPIDGIPHGNGLSNPTAIDGGMLAQYGAGDVMREIESHITYLQTLQIEMFREFKLLPFYQKQVIYYYYLSGKRWVWIAGKLSYSRNQCIAFRDRGIEALRRAFEANPNIKPLEENYSRTS